MPTLQQEQPGGLQSALDVFVAVTAVDRWLAAQALLAWAKLRPSALQASFVGDVLPSLLPQVVASQRLAAAFGATGVRQQALRLVASPTSVVPQPPARAPHVPTLPDLPGLPPLPKLPASSGLDVRQAAASPSVVSDAFANIASDGRPLVPLLSQPLVSTYLDIGSGVPVDLALRRGMDSMDRILTTQVHDAAREAGQVQMVGIREITEYQRVVEPTACDRCLILSGRIYKWNKGFLRHPACRCVHQMITEETAVPLSDRDLFDAMTADQQDRAFGVDGAQAIRDGADPAKVVNARRGMSTAVTASGRNVASPQTVYGQQLLTTTVGAGQNVRLMPQGIYQIAGDDRGLAIDLLQRHGYLTH